MTAVAHSISPKDLIASSTVRGRIAETYLSGFPVEERRVFLFIDLHNSTMLAENLGHLKYSLFLSRFFADFHSCLQNTSGEVYQYVGDEVIATWKSSRKDAIQPVELIKRLNRMLQNNRDRYTDEFGVAPGFKAALHQGWVAVSRIGLQKVYHGDVLNTCSRMLQLASRSQNTLLVSEEVIEELDVNSARTQMDVSSIRGKKNPVKIFTIHY
jgi:adenylate cyclase